MFERVFDAVAIPRREHVRYSGLAQPCGNRPTCLMAEIDIEDDFVAWIAVASAEIG